jgi:hypothetical protein
MRSTGKLWQMGLDRGKAPLGKQDGQRDFFDGYVEQRLLPEEHELIKKSLEIDYPRSKTTGYSANFILT